MRIDEALVQVRAIQTQVARTEQFCCYRWATVTGSGALAIIAAGIQPMVVPQPAQHPDAFLMLWVAVAALNVGMVGAEMLVRWLRSDSDFARRQTVLAVQQFAPCLIAGALLTLAMRSCCPDQAWLLPALWSILFSLGIYASGRHLPAGTTFVASYYLAAGLLCIRFAQGEQTLQPWTMALTFGAGQFITGFILYRHREPADGT
jgi:hypothetical protein